MNAPINVQKITACAFLHNNNKLFIAKRAATKKFLPGKFELPGGHIEYGEDIVEGLKREFREEFGVEIIVGNVVHAFTYMNGDSHVVEVDYLAELVNVDAEMKLNPEDHSEYRWVDRAELVEIWDKQDAEYIAIQRGFETIMAPLSS
ncbi:TPA: 8-oxo-dGTP diphosphatase MutT [Candidatus Uhrbacteria bacterium]|nr:8-oxo-dGTP diphosphatase MutT [Candidatus Uhrbacteria bacterium]